jgi:hypothetical protein
MDSVRNKFGDLGQTRVELLMALACWAKENFNSLPGFLQRLLSDPAYFPDGTQSFKLQTPEVFLELDAQSFTTAYRLMDDSGGQSAASPP